MSDEQSEQLQQYWYQCGKDEADARISALTAKVEAASRQIDQEQSIAVQLQNKVDALAAENERLREALKPLLATTQEYQAVKAQLEEVLSRRPTVKGTAGADGSERFEEWRREYAPLHDKVYRTLLWKIADAAEDLRSAIDAKDVEKTV